MALQYVFRDWAFKTLKCQSRSQAKTSFLQKALKIKNLRGDSIWRAKGKIKYKPKLGVMKPIELVKRRRKVKK